MKIILLLTMSLCAVHCSDILVKVIQEVHIGNCGRGCSKCKEASSALAAAEEKLTELQEEQTELENQVTAAEQTESSVSDAGEAVTNVTDAISGSRRRHRRALIRHRRQAASFTYTSCEDSSSITSSVEDATLAILQGIISALQTIAGGNLNSDTLDCYVALAGDLVDGISDGSLEIPDNTSAIESLADEVTAEVTTTSTAVQEVKEELIQTLEEKKAEVEAQETVVESSGGTVEDVGDNSLPQVSENWDDQDKEKEDEEESTNWTNFPPLTEFPGDRNPGGGIGAVEEDNVDEYLIYEDYCDNVDCKGPPSEDCVEVDGLHGCCPTWSCDGLPTNCTDKDGNVYGINEHWNPESCRECWCYYNSRRGAYAHCYDKYCYNNYRPHRDCLIGEKDNITCCTEYFCANTTCKSDGRYYGIGDTWQLRSDPCQSCNCSADGNETKIDCVTEDCPEPPQDNCRPIKHVDKCCAQEWDCSNEYLLTTPKKWIRDQDASVCVFTGSSSNASAINVTFILKDDDVTVEKNLVAEGGNGSVHCTSMTVPESIANTATLDVSGHVGPAEINKKLKVKIGSVLKTFVQTDKFLYMPGQAVQFRIVTITGTKTLVSYDNITEVWIVSPGGSRLAQWKDLKNPDGLLQLEYPLADEVEEGKYTIEVRTERTKASQRFRVEEYELPRFTLTVQPPPYVLLSASEIVFLACAKYTFGRPVTGTLLLTLNKSVYGYYYGSSSKELASVTKEFSGCDNITVSTTDFGSVWFKIEVLGSFTEKDTDNVMNSSTTIQLQYRSIIFTKLSRENYAKPGLPYLLQVRVTRPDSSPAEGELIEVCVKDICKNYTVDGTGMIKPIVPPHLMTSKYTGIKVRDFNAREKGPMGSTYEARDYYYIESYYSPSNSSLSLDLSYETLVCPQDGENISLPVFFVSNDMESILLHVQLVSRSQIIYTGQWLQEDVSPSPLPIDESELLEPMQSINGILVRGSFNIEIPVTSLSSPNFHILVWYARADGEVVSASVDADVSKCLRNPTSLKWSVNSEGDPAPKDEAQITIESSPNSLCGLDVVDRSVEVLSRGQQGRITINAIFELLRKADPSPWGNSQIDDTKYCTGRDTNYGNYDYYNDDYPLEFRRQKRSISPSYYNGYSEYVDAIKAFDDSGLLVLSDLTLETRPCIQNNYYGGGGDYYGGGPVYEDYDMAKPAKPAKPALAPDGDGDSAAVGGSEEDSLADREEPENDDESEDDESSVRTYFPETWLWEIVVIGDTGEKVKDVQFPGTVTEWVGKAVCANPQKGIGISSLAAITTFMPFFLDLSYPPTARRGEVLPIQVSVFNYLGRSLPVNVTLQPSSEYDSTTESIEVCIDQNDKEVATFEVTFSEVGEVNMTFTATIDNDNGDCGDVINIEKSDTVVRPVMVKYEGVTKEDTNSDYLCEGDAVTWPVISPLGIIENSDRVFVSASADLMGPTLENLGHLIRMPYGCGEQNMLNFAPNIFILQYLQASDQLTPDIERKLKEFMSSGYQRELNYRHTDGSYSAFGNSDPSGSTWLTAFVLKSFAQAADYITVDEDDLQLTTDWLLSQQRKDGCFNSVGTVIHKSMKGGLAGSGTSLAPLTAYVITSLLEAGQASDSEVITNALTCIQGNASANTYVNALKAYALALANNSDADGLIASVYSSLMSGISGLSKETTVEASGYALLAMTTRTPEAYAGQSANMNRLLNTYRSGGGGFVSTQDTVVALDGMSKFLIEFPPTDADLAISISAGSQSYQISITPDNRLLLHTQNIDETTPFNVTLSALGTGCAVVMLVHRYNVPDDTGSPAFSLDLRVGCTTPVVVDVCFSYLLEDEASNMAVVDIQPETGYFIQKQSLIQIKEQGVIKRFENDEGSTLVYLDSVTSEEICLPLTFEKMAEVGELLPGTVTLYDYYQSEFRVTKKLIISEAGDGCNTEETITEETSTEETITEETSTEEQLLRSTLAN